MSTGRTKTRKNAEALKNAKTPEGRRGARALLNDARRKRAAGKGIGQFTGAASGSRRRKISGRAREALVNQVKGGKAGGGQ